MNLGKRGILFEQRNAQTDLARVSTRNPFFNHEPHEQARKFFIGIVALTEGIAREFVIWPIVFSD